MGNSVSGNEIGSIAKEDNIIETPNENETARDSVTTAKKTFSFISKLKKSKENTGNKLNVEFKENIEQIVSTSKDTNVQQSIIYSDNRCKKRLFLKNEFYNIDKYIKTKDTNYLIKDLEKYENNLNEETKTIENLFNNIYISNDNINLKEQIELEMKASLDSKLSSKRFY